MLKRMFVSFAFVLITMMGLSTYSYAQGPNLFVDGDFLSGTTASWTSFTNLFGSATNVVTVPTGGAQVGNMGQLYVQTNNGEASLSQSFFSTDPTPMNPGALYRFNFSHRTNRTSGMTAKVTIDDGVNPPTVYNLTLSNSVAIESQYFFTPDATSTGVTITFYVKSTLGSSGICYMNFDNVSFTEMR